jgi:nitrate reductase NapD
MTLTTAQPAEELHIASLVVHAAPSCVRDVRRAVANLPGAMVHAATASGKLVVTLERPTAADMAESVQTIQRLDGVLVASLVYQCADTLQAMNEELR